MGQVTVEVNGRPYTVGCEDGQETHLQELARMFDRQVRMVSEDMGQLGDTRLLLMGALLLADELFEAKIRLSAQQGEIIRMQADQHQIEARAAQALDLAARRIERLAAEDV